MTKYIRKRYPALDICDCGDHRFQHRNFNWRKLRFCNCEDCSCEEFILNNEVYH
jgi:hypothetical protein